MKTKWLAICVCILSVSTNATAADQQAKSQCEMYRAEIEEINNALDAKYGDRIKAVYDKSADPAVRNRVIREYSIDPMSLRLRVLSEKFRPDRKDECSHWVARR